MAFSRLVLGVVSSLAAGSAAAAVGAAMTVPSPQTARPAGIQRAPFGTLPGGEAVEIFTLTNANGIELAAIGYGGIITSLKVPDRAGKLDDIVLGFDRLEDYVTDHPFFGAIIGRYGNRIAKGQFALGGQTYKLAVNNGPNHLHGGNKGFDKVVWKVEPAGHNALTFSRVSPDGEEGYPGNLRVQVT